MLVRIFSKGDFERFRDLQTISVVIVSETLGAEESQQKDLESLFLQAAD